jgi:acyl carrier protein
MPVKSEDEVLSELTEILRDFEGREYSGHIDRDTLFFGDLGFASIDAVLLGEKLEEQYGRRFPFHELLAELGKQGAEDVDVGTLSAFIHRQLVSEE